MKKLIMIIFIILFSNLESFSQVTDSLWNQEQISNATVLLYQPINDSTAFTGSGTIVYHSSRYFLLTANHVAKEMKGNAKLVFRLTGDKPGIIDLLPLIKNRLLKWINHPVADISLIELIPINQDVKQRLRDCAFPIARIYNSKILPSREADITFLGFPIIDLEMEHFSPLMFTGYLASGLITQLRYDTKTKCNFFYLNVPSIQGCSGSGVYYSVKKDMYFGGSVTLLIGIVHGTQGDNTGGKLAAITPSYYIFDLLKDL